MSWIDAHIHLDKYEPEQLQRVIEEALAENIERVVAVSVNFNSSKFNYELYKQFPNLIYPCYGFHPEQPLPSEKEEVQLFNWIEQCIEQNESFAIGEIGLPYYQQQEAIEKGEVFELEPYIAHLKRWFLFAQKHKKPVALHVIYDHVDIVLELLNDIPLKDVHFHWYKGSDEATEEVIRRGYMISISPDVVYEPYTQKLITQVPLPQMMVETDGPWQYEDEFSAELTTPRMVKRTSDMIAFLLQMNEQQVSKQLYENSRRFYRII